MKRRLQRGLALLLTLCLLSGNLAFAEELPAQSAETSIREEAPAQNGESLPRENEAEVPEENEAEAPEENVENAPEEQEEALDVSPEHTPEALREGVPEEGEYRLNLTIRRPIFSGFGNMMAIYMKHWMYQEAENNPVYDAQAQELIDFEIEYELHMTGQSSIKQEANCHGYAFLWDEKIDFPDISVPYEELEVIYYTPDGQDWFEPYLLHYDLYLEKGDGKMILKVPKLESKGDETPQGNNQVLRVEHTVRDLNPLYLNGTNGDDGNSGASPDQAVKTFSKAKDLAKANPKIKTITVTGETPLRGEISLAGTSAQIKRADDYNGYLFSVSKKTKASLSDIVIDGNKNNKSIENSLIEVESGATLEVKKGAHLRNNVISDSAPGIPDGGAIHANSATIEMTGGEISENAATYGGGMYLEASTLHFSDGILRNNRAKPTIIAGSAVKRYGAGGGILATDTSKITLTGNAQILNNEAAENGGGISLGKQNELDDSVLHMTGGTIAGNTAGASGGGLFVQCSTQAWISAGVIKDNQMTGKGLTNMNFGGGGIYVNGHRDFPNGELHLTNAVITENQANGTKEYPDLNDPAGETMVRDLGSGGGYAACPVTKTTIHVNDGVAIYQNGAEDSGNDLYILANAFYGIHSGEPEYDLSLRMLGGALWNWEYDRDGVIHVGGNDLPIDKYKGTIRHKGTSDDLPLLTRFAGNPWVEKLAKVWITGNTSETRGGGIGSNGDVIFGTAGKTTKVSVEKKWEDRNNAKKKRPEKIQVELLAKIEGGNKEYVVETRELSDANEWKTVFEELPTVNEGKKIIYSVREVVVNGYETTITGSADKGFIITNKPEKPPRPGEKTVEIPVEKIWQDEGHEDKRPTEITVALYADGARTDKTLVLSAANEWKGVFRNLPEKKDGKIITYTVKEVEVKGYESVRTGNQHDGFVLTNTYKPEKPPTPPTPPTPPKPPIPIVPPTVRIPRAGA